MSKMESKSDDVRVNRGGNAPRGYRGAGGGGGWRGPAPAGRGRPDNARAPPPNRRGRENGSHANESSNSSRMVVNDPCAVNNAQSMASRAQAYEREQSTHEQCCICCNAADFFCIGLCAHPVCFECGVRLRIVCDKNECSICRSKMTKPVLPSVERQQQFVKVPKITDKYGLMFESDDALHAYTDLLAHVCTLCDNEPEFKTFVELDAHMKREHNMFYCDLCVTHLKLFSWERKCYTRQELAHHRRQGDTDDQSYEPHPLCRFCDNRFLDADHLYRHLRTDHYYCHMCDADGVSNVFYDAPPNLHAHFVDTHFICDDPECAEFPWSAYREEVELRMHKASRHGRRRGERVVQLEVAFGVPSFMTQPPPQHEGQGRGRGAGYRGGGDKRGGRQPTYAGRRAVSPTTDAATMIDRSSTTEKPAEKGIELRSSDFPSLTGGAGSSSASMSHPPGIYGRTMKTALNNTQEFPALSKSKPVVQRDEDEGVVQAAVESHMERGLVIVDDQEDAKTFHTHAVHGRPAPVRAADSESCEDDDAQPAGAHHEMTTSSTFIEPAVAQPSMFERLTQSGVWENRSLRDVSRTMQGGANVNAFPPLASVAAPAQGGSGWAAKTKATNKAQIPKSTPATTAVNGATVRSSEDTYTMVPLTARLKTKVRRMAARNQRTSSGSEDFPTLNDVEVPPVPPGLVQPARWVPPVSVGQPPPLPSGESSVRTQPNAKQVAAKNGTQSPATYVNPPDFRDRNKRLFDSIERVMRTASRRTVHSPDPSANPMADFKTASVSYRNGKMTAEEYYATVQRLVGGAQQLRVFFAELVALLPDVTAQNKLVEVHRQRADMDGVGPLKTANKPSAWNVQVRMCVHMCRHSPTDKPVHWLYARVRRVAGVQQVWTSVVGE